jgi:heterodisulfide reductase subunit B
MMQYSYYPGCSLGATSKMYDASTRAVFSQLGAELIELEDWNCCGATAYMSTDELLSLSISARNLAIAEKLGLDLVTPCSGCYVTLNKARKYFLEFPEIKRKLTKVLESAGLSFSGKQRVRHVLDVLANDIGLKQISKNVKKNLNGLKVAPYYGCQVVRPFTELDDPDDPMMMDNLLLALGADVVPFAYKTRCCGGAQMGTNQDLALSMVTNLLKCASSAEADVIATTCPLCQINLEAYQKKISRMTGHKFNIPVLYFTQLTALAFGLPDSATLFKKHIVPFQGIPTNA